MSLLVPARVEQEELLDEHDAPYADMVRSLEDLRRINTFAGGIRTYRRMLRRLAQLRNVHDLKILDLGTGTSDLPASILTSDRSIGLDMNIRHLWYGRRRWPDAVLRVGGDAFRLPLKDGTVDVVTSSHFAHHFSLEENVQILDEALRVCRVGVLITDTRRHRAPLLFVRLIGLANLVGRITKFDAPASVLRGYTVNEIRRMMKDVRCSRFELRRYLPFRWGLLIWK